MCHRNHLTISNTFFRCKPIHRDTYTHPDGYHHEMIDFALVNQRFRSSVLHTRVKRNARSFIDSDHQLVVCKVRLKLRTKIRRPRCNIDSDRLAHDKDTATAFQRSVNEKLPDLPDEKLDDLEVVWESFKDAVITSATNTAKTIHRRNIPWLTRPLIAAIEVKATA